jgi:isochorismate synthase
MEAGMEYKIADARKITFEIYLEVCKRHGFGCALYRLPQSDTRHLIIDLNGGRNIEKVQIENIGSGYVFHPFSTEKHDVKFLKEDIHLSKGDSETEIQILKSVLPENELSALFGQKETEENIEPERSGDHLAENVADDRENYLNLVKKTIDKIKDDRFQKVVISRSKHIELPPHFNAYTYFNALCDKYANGFIHLTYIPGAGLWIGATPEILIEIDKDNQFQTVALAATQAYDKNTDIEDTTWSQKDIEEQAMVSRYIINCFKKIRLREFEEIGPRTHLSGNLVHLKTSYLVNIDQVAFPELGTVMLELLHPTSAVCGMPKEATMAYIQENEGFDRLYFSGYLGPVNVLNETNIFVNLRTMKISGTQAQLFAGAGIIANSNPEKEWHETEIKMNTLLSVLKEL